MKRHETITFPGPVEPIGLIPDEDLRRKPRAYDRRGR